MNGSQPRCTVSAAAASELDRWLADHPRPPGDSELEDWKSQIHARGGEHGHAFLDLLGCGGDDQKLRAIAALSELGVAVWIAVRDGQPAYFARLRTGATTVVVPAPDAGDRPTPRIGSDEVPLR